MEIRGIQEMAEWTLLRERHRLADREAVPWKNTHLGTASCGSSDGTERKLNKGFSSGPQIREYQYGGFSFYDFMSNPVIYIDQLSIYMLEDYIIKR